MLPATPANPAATSRGVTKQPRSTCEGDQTPAEEQGHFYTTSQALARACTWPQHLTALQVLQDLGSAPHPEAVSAAWTFLSWETPGLPPQDAGHEDHQLQEGTRGRASGGTAQAAPPALQFLPPLQLCCWRGAPVLRDLQGFETARQQGTKHRGKSNRSLGIIRKLLQEVARGNYRGKVNDLEIRL